MCLKGNTCLCGVHVSTATRAIAIWGLALHGLSILFTVVLHQQNEESQLGSMVKALNIYWIMIAINLSLLLGSLYKKPILYWPYLIFMLCALLFLILFVAGVVCFGSFAVFIGDQSKFADHRLPLDFLGQNQHIEQATNATTKAPKIVNHIVSIQVKLQMLLMLTIISFVLICITIIHGYMLSIVFRGYRWLKSYLTEQGPTNQLELYEQKY